MTDRRDPDPTIRAARRGASEAQDRLIEACRQDLERFLQKQMGPRLGRHYSLSDLGQETFLRAFRGIDRLRDDASLSDFRRYLYRHARWVAVELGRKAQDMFGESNAEDDRGPPRDVEASPTGEVTHRDDVAWLEARIDRLDPRYADVVRLRLKDLSFAEVADRLGIHEATARKRYLRAAAQLARIREQRDDPES